MEHSQRKDHWENVYGTKQLTEVSWYQPTPATSLNFIKEANPTKDAAIIDIGGGDSFLVDNLLEQGYTNISVLDISEKGIERAKVRLGDKARLVKWIVADAALFKPSEQYDLWHDRAAFHFLITEMDISSYVKAVSEGIKADGTLVIGTFSEQGPKKCSGLEIKQYSESNLTNLFSESFEKLTCFTEDHPTPFQTVQNFIFCSFKRK